MGGLMLLDREKYRDRYYTSAFILGSVNVGCTKLNLQNLLETYIDYPSIKNIQTAMYTIHLSGKCVALLVKN